MVPPIHMPRVAIPQPGQMLDNGWPGKKNVGERERWLSLIAGIALAGFGISRRSPLGIALALIGADFIYRGATRRSLVYQMLDINRSNNDEHPGILVEKAVTIDKQPAELYRYWRNVENLPRIMQHLRSVTELTSIQSHWVADAPAGITVEWDAEITDDRPDEIIAWHSLPGADIENEGSVRFIPAPGNRGTEVHVKLVYQAPAGSLGAAVAKLFGEEPAQQVTDDLRRFKRMMETGEIPTVEGQPTGD